MIARLPRSRHLPVLLSLMAVISCGDGSQQPTSLGTSDPTGLLPGPAYAIVDGAHGGDVPGFRWLPPSVASQKGPPPTFDGTFDGGLLSLAPPNELQIEICEIDGSDPAQPSECSVLRTLNGSDPPEEIRVDLEAENYSATWQSTNSGEIRAGATYRAFVSAGGRVLGYLDLVAVEKTRELKRIDDTEFGGLVVGSPFVFKFRVETGIPGEVVVTPADPTIKDDETQLFTATVGDLYGDPLPGVGVDWTIGDPSIALLSPTSGTTDGSGETGTTATPAGSLGTTTVEATSQGAVGSTTLTVEPSEVAPTAVDDAYGPVGTFPFVVTAGGTPDGLLANDAGIPDPRVSSFGGGDLGGAVTDHAADATIDFGTGGSLTVNADGGFSFTPSDGFVGDFTFEYRAANSAGTDDGEVVITVEEAPMVQSTTPADGATNQATDVDIVVTFSEAVTVSDPWYEIVCTTSGGHTATESGGPTTYTLDPAADFTEGEECSVTIDKDQVEDQDGTPDNMAADHVFTFTIDVAPTVVSTDPADGDIDVQPTDVITITFSESVNATVASFTLECPAGDGVSFGLSASPSSSFILTPDADLPAGTTCTLTVVAGEISDTDAGDPPDQMASDFTFSFTVPVQAVDDDYPETVVGNVSVNSANAGGGAFSVLANDLAMNAIQVDVPASATSSASGGDVTFTAGGEFTYDPPPGFEGTDMFIYTITDGITSAVGTVTVMVQDMIWFVDNTAAVAGDGRLSAPFNCLVSAACFSSVAPDDPGDVIFLYESATAYEGGVTLLPGQLLVGQDATASLSALTGIAPPASSAAFPAMNTGAPATTIVTTAAATDAVTLGTGNALHGFTVGNTTGVAVAGTNFGTATLDDVSVTGTGGALDLANGTIGFTFDALTSSSATRGIDLDAVAGSLVHAAASSLSGHSAEAVRITNSSLSFDYDGGITNSGSGIVLTSNVGATLDFGGLLTLVTGADAAFTATDGGTVTATGAGSSLLATTATALNVQNTTIGAAGLTFRQISSDGGADPGIVLNNTGTSGGLTVTGDGGGASNGSGGTIQNKTGNGVTLTSTRRPSLNYMNVDANGDNGILGTSLNGFVLTRSNLRDNANAVSPDEAGLHLLDLSGGALGSATETRIADVLVEDSHENNVIVRSSSGTVANLSVTASTFRNDGGSGVAASQFLVDASGTANITVNASSSTFDGNGEAGALTGFGFVADAAGTSDIVANVSGSTFTDNNVALSASASAGGDVTFDYSNNPTVTGNRSNGINVFASSTHTGNIVGTISGNTVGTSGTMASGSETGAGISASNEGGGLMRLLIDNNVVQEVGTNGFEGIFVNEAVSAGTTEATITNNTIRDIDFDRGLQARITSTGTMCTDIRGNAFSDIADSDDLRVFQSAGTHNNEQKAPTGAVDPLELDDANGGATVDVTGTINFEAANCALPPA